MKLLVLTQKVDMGDSNLGFFHSWIFEFAKLCSQVTVICLQEGSHDLSANVSVKSLGKERGTSKLSQILHFMFYILHLRHEYDAVFVHMNPEYVILGGLFWRLLGKKIALWYTHKHVDLKLKIAEKFANIIFTASSESFRLKSKKVVVTGHGVDTEFFSPGPKHFRGHRIVTAGRITPAKHIKEMIEAVGPDLIVAGVPITPTDYIYAKELESKANFIGSVSYMPDFYRSADLFLSLSTTGSIDKSVLEALACGTPVLTTNEAFKQVPQIYTELTNLSQAIKDNLDKPQPSLREWVIREHSLKRLIPRIIHELS